MALLKIISSLTVFLFVGILFVIWWNKPELTWMQLFQDNLFLAVSLFASRVILAVVEGASQKI